MNIGIALDNTLNERWNKEIFFIKKRVESEGGLVHFRTAFGLPNTQLDNVRELILEDKINVLILVPVDAEYAKNIVELCQTHGVKVIAYSRPILHKGVDFQVRFDVPLIGKQQVEVALQNKTEGNFVIIQGPTQDLNTGLLLEGQMELLSPKINSGEVNLLGTYYLSGWTKIKAARTVDDCLSQHNGMIDAFIVANDMIAEAVIEQIGSERNIIVTGLDAEVKACKRVADGHQTMTVLLVPQSIANCIGNVALYLASSNEKYLKEYTVEMDEVAKGIQIKTIQLESEVLDQDNVKDKILEHKLFPLGWLD
jgi:ABC-type xylose transport system substrate-binding protein